MLISRFLLYSFSLCMFFSYSQTAFVKVTDEDATYGDLEHNIKIETPSATYYFNKEGGGFAGVLDKNGIDWVGHSKALEDAGEWRGIPNTNIVGWRPEQKGSITKIESVAPDKVVLSCEKKGYKCQWTFFPDHATITFLEVSDKYYFTYEGAPNGIFNTGTGYFVRADADKTYLDVTSPETDIKAVDNESYEWCYFGDDNSPRVFAMIHHEDDTVPDYYRPAKHMTIFGFGRTGAAIENLSTAPQSFTISFIENTEKTEIAKSIKNLMAIK